MIKLHSSGGAEDVEVLSPALDDIEWLKLRTRVAQLIRTRGNGPVADLIDEMPFRLHWGTNHFNDEFMLLIAELPVERFAKVGDGDPVRRAAYRLIAETLAEYGVPVRLIVVVPESPESIQGVPAPVPAITSAIVERALRDADALMKASGPSSAVDRVHTALHGYLRAHCEGAGIEASATAGVTQLFQALRAQHPRFGAVGPRSQDIDRILRGLSAVLDAVNTIRNRASAAHPSESLLQEPEAALLVNSVRSLLHYLDARLSQ